MNHQVDTQNKLETITSKLSTMTEVEKDKVLAGFLTEDIKDEGWYVHYLYYVMCSTGIITE
ncbi:hypothetical protein [Caudoviricetes sp.]|nr:hypothetical protein [Caudoviricetes sp.]